MTNSEKVAEILGIPKEDMTLINCQGFVCKAMTVDCEKCPYFRFWSKEYMDEKN